MAEDATDRPRSQSPGGLGLELAPIRYLSKVQVVDPNARSPIIHLEAPQQEFAGTPASPTYTPLSKKLQSSVVVRRAQPLAAAPAPEPTVEDIPALLLRLAKPITDEDREFAASGLCNLLAAYDTHDALLDNGGLPILLQLVRDPALPKDTHYAVTCALHNVTCKVSNLSAIVAEGGVEILVQLMRGLPLHHMDSLQSVVQMLRRLSFQADPIKQRLVALGTVPSMVAIIKGDYGDVTKANAAAAIQSLSFVNDRLLDDYPTAVATLIDLLLSSTNKQTQGCLTGALQNFSVHGCKFMGPTIPRFVRLLRSDTLTTVKCAALVLHNLAVEPEYKIILLHSGTAPVLVKLVDAASSPVDLRLYCLGCLHYLAHAETARAQLLEDGAVRCAMNQLGPTGNALLRDHALGLLQHVAQHQPLQRPLAQMGCLQVLVREIAAAHNIAGHRYLATVALNYLCFHNSSNKLQAVEAGAVPAIISVATTPNLPDKHLESLLAALQSLSVEETTAVTILEHGGVPVLLGCLGSGTASATAKEYAAGTLQNMVCEPEAVGAIAATGVAVLLKVLSTPGSTTVAMESAAAIIQTLSLDDDTRACLATQEVIEVLLAALERQQGALHYGLQEELLGALQNVSMYVAARVQLVRAGAVPWLAQTLRQPVPSVVKERAVFTLYHISLDNLAYQQLIGRTGILPVLEAYAWKYAHDPDLRTQLTQFQETVTFALTLPDQPDPNEAEEDDDIALSRSGTLGVPPEPGARRPSEGGYRRPSDAAGYRRPSDAGTRRPSEAFSRTASLFSTNTVGPARQPSSLKREAIPVEPERLTSVRLEVIDADGADGHLRSLPARPPSLDPEARGRSSKSPPKVAVGSPKQRQDRPSAIVPPDGSSPATHSPHTSPKTRPPRLPSLLSTPNAASVNTPTAKSPGARITPRSKNSPPAKVVLRPSVKALSPRGKQSPAAAAATPSPPKHAPKSPPTKSPKTRPISPNSRSSQSTTAPKGAALVASGRTKSK